MSREKVHVIIGNSAAGLSAIRSLRKMRDSHTIVLISAERCNAYSPVLSTYYIGGKILRANLFIVDDEFYKIFNVRTMFGRIVMDIDPVKRLVYLNDLSRVRYDDLLIATGASAVPLENVDGDAVQYVTALRTISDADRIEKASKKARKIIIIGGGLVSLQIINAVLGKGIRITLAVGSYQILSQQIDFEFARIIQEKLEAQGVSILFGRRIHRVYQKGQYVNVLTNFNEVLQADLVIVGKGVKPNVTMVQTTSLKIKDGIVVDDKMMTNLDGIFAAGDVAEGKNMITGKMEVIATWSNACAQGEIAGMNMAGYTAKRKNQFRENVTKIAGIPVVLIGLTKPEEDKFKELRYFNEKEGVYRKFFLDGQNIVGAILMGRVEDAGIVRHCIASHIDISTWEDKIAKGPLNVGKIILGGNFNFPVH